MDLGQGDAFRGRGFSKFTWRRRHGQLLSIYKFD
jgi:hypothetical protein